MTPALYKTAQQLARQAQTAFPDVHIVFLEENLATGLENAIREHERFERMIRSGPRKRDKIADLC